MGKLSGIPVWCFTGPELGEKEKEIQNILSEVRAEFGTVDEYSFYPEETPVPQIVQILLNGSLFSAGKFIVVNEAHTIKKKEEISLIKTWLDGRTTKTQDTQLIFTSSEISLDKKLESLIPKEHQKIFWELQEQKKESWLVRVDIGKRRSKDNSGTCGEQYKGVGNKMPAPYTFLFQGRNRYLRKN